MRRTLQILVVAALAAAGAAQAQTSEDRVLGRAPLDTRCSLVNHPSAACGMLRAGSPASLRFEDQARLRERRDLYARLNASLERGDCEGARAQAVDEGRHQLAALIRRACVR